jgi:hypothetical protein
VVSVTNTYCRILDFLDRVIIIIIIISSSSSSSSSSAVIYCTRIRDAGSFQKCRQAQLVKTLHGTGMSINEVLYVSCE